MMLASRAPINTTIQMEFCQSIYPTPLITATTTKTSGILFILKLYA